MLERILAEPAIVNTIPLSAMIAIAALTLVVCANSKNALIRWPLLGLTAAAAAAGPVAIVLLNPGTATIAGVAVGAVGIFVEIGIIIALARLVERSKMGQGLMVAFVVLGGPPTLGLMRTAPSATGVLSIALMWIVVTGGRGVWRRAPVVVEASQ